MAKNMTIGIVVFEGVLTSEVIGPAEVFGIAAKSPQFTDSRVLLIGVEEQPTIQTEEGIRLMVDANISDDLSLDILLVPGGNDMSQLLEHEKLNAFIGKQEKNVEWLGSVCAGAFLLGKTGSLNGKQATTWFGGESSLQAQFREIKVVHDKPIVLDQRRITANGGLVSYRAALVLLGQIGGSELAHEVYTTLNMDRLGNWLEIEADMYK